MKKAISIAVLCLPLLVGCGIFQRKIEAPVIAAKEINVDPKLLAPCDPLVKLVIPQGASNMDPYFTDNIGQNALIYAKCRDSNDAKAEFIRRVIDETSKKTN